MLPLLLCVWPSTRLCLPEGKDLDLPPALSSLVPGKLLGHVDRHDMVLLHQFMGWGIGSFLHNLRFCGKWEVFLTE